MPNLSVRRACISVAVVFAIIGIIFYFFRPQSWSKDLLEKHKSLITETAKVRKELKDKRLTWEEKKKGKAFSDLAACTEDWEAGFSQAEKSLALAEKGLDEALTIISKKDFASESKLTVKLASVGGFLEGARKQMRKPFGRLSALTKVSNNPESFMGEARNLAMQVVVSGGAVTDILGDIGKSYPERLDEAKAKVAGFLKEVNDLSAGLALAEAELAKVMTGKGKREVNYSAIGNIHEALSKKNEKLLNDGDKWCLELAGVFHSRELHLLGEKAEFSASFLLVLYDDDGSHKMVEFSCEVNEDFWLFLNGWLSAGRDELASGVVKLLDSSFTWDNKSGVYGPIWDKITQTANGIERPWGYGEADIFPAGLSIKAWHRYRLLADGKISETDWEEVGFEDFWRFKGMAGVAIESKPYGAFTSEMVTEAMPVGINLVGNQAYGHWRGEGEQSVWVWLDTFSAYADWSAGWWDGHYSHNDFVAWRRYGSYKPKEKPAHFWSLRTPVGRQGKVAFGSPLHKPLLDKMTLVGKKPAVSAENVNSLTEGRHLRSPANIFLKDKTKMKTAVKAGDRARDKITEKAAKAASDKASAKAGQKAASKAASKAVSKAASKAASKASSKAASKAASKSSSRK